MLGDVTNRLPIAALRAYSAFAYAAFAVTTVWAIAFLANIPMVPNVDGGPQGPVWLALVVDSALLLVFALQHSVMARAGVKARMARVVPVSAQRSTYVLTTSLCLGLMFWQWRRLSGSVWHVEDQPWVGLLWGVCALGWATAVCATFMIDHLDFLGLRQGGWARSPDGPAPFSERWMYAWLRHPMMLGLVVAFWATPSMTVGHLLFATAASGYIAVGVRFEERDLRRELGEVYVDYARRVPQFVPRAPAGARKDRTDVPAARVVEAVGASEEPE
jgi:protein-S-isoprenylcysteine O-methyltransferase Ste14